jgi:predicted regulator of Ras-like GTPase activity (Roadblock/LC7/MglB family)
VSGALSRQPGRSLDWLLDDFMRGTPGVVHALVVSADGLRVAASERLDTRLGDQLSAATSGLVSLANGAARLVQMGPMAQTIVELAGGHLFVTQIREGASLAVVADRGCDMGMVGYEMTMLASQVGHALTPATRSGRRWPS